MKKYFYTFIIVQLLFAGLLPAQQKKVWVPYFRFRCDNNEVERHFLVSEGNFNKNADHRFADGQNVVSYHFKLKDFADANSKTPLTIRFQTWNEFIVKASGSPITNSTEGDLVAQYSDQNPLPPARDGNNVTNIEMPLDDAMALYNDDLYINFFDGRPEDGWGPSIPSIGFYYKVDSTSVPRNLIDAALGNMNFINVDGDFSDWAPENKWISVAKGAANTVSTGTIADNKDLSAQASICFDNDNVYFAAKVTDNQLTAGKDSVLFYLGTYNVSDSLNQLGHLNFKLASGSTLPGYRKHTEPDYRFAISVKETGATINESNICLGPVEDSKVAVVKTTDGYNVEAVVPLYALHITDSTNSIYAVNPDHYLPFAFQVKDVDGTSVKGALIAGADDKVDVSPSSWVYKTSVTDKRQIVDDKYVKGMLKSIIPGGNDQDFIVAKYKGSTDGSHRWADNTDTLAFHFDIAQLKSIVPNQEVFVSFTVGNEYVMNVAGSETGKRTQYAIWSTKNVPEHDEANRKDIEISLDQMQQNGYMDLHVFFTDGIPTDGWGASVRGIKIYYKGIPNDNIIYQWTPGTDPSKGDAAYLVANNGSGADNNHRWTDGTSSFGYKFNLKDIASKCQGKEALFKVYIENEYVISSAETENGSKTEVLKWSSKNIPEHDGKNAGWVTISLLPYMAKGLDNIYFFFTDGITTDGWGGALRNANISYRDLQGYYSFDEFIPSTNVTSESNYLVDGHTGSGVTDHHRFADGTTDITYHFKKADLVQKAGTDKVIVRFIVENEYVVSVKPHMDSTATQALIWSAKKVPETSGANKGTQEVDLKPLFDKGWNDVYMVFTDGIPEDGWGPALYKVTLSMVKNIVSDVKEISSTIPHTFAVEQNYPNPFNPVTSIRYAIPNAGKISLVVYDILGREVKTLVNDIQNAGTYQVSWKGDNNFGEKVSSGIYFYRVSFDNKQQISKKMIMLK